MYRLPYCLRSTRGNRLRASRIFSGGTLGSAFGVRGGSQRLVVRERRPVRREVAGELEDVVVVVSIAAVEHVLEADQERAHAGLRDLGVCDAVRVPARWAHEERRAAVEHGDPEHELLARGNGPTVTCLPTSVLREMFSRVPSGCSRKSWLVNAAVAGCTTMSTVPPVANSWPPITPCASAGAASTSAAATAISAA